MNEDRALSANGTRVTPTRAVPVKRPSTSASRPTSGTPNSRYNNASLLFKLFY